MKFSDGTRQSPEIFRPILSSNSPPDLNRRVAASYPKPHFRRNGKQALAGDGARWRRHGALGGRGSGLATPLPRWKFHDGDLAVTGDHGTVPWRTSLRRVRGEAVVSVSARKLAAGLWQFAAEVTDAGGGISSQCGPFDRVGFKPGVGHAMITFPCHRRSIDCDAKTKDWLQSSLSDHGLKHETLHKFSLPFQKSVMEGATKWDPGYSKISTEFYYFYSHMKLLDSQQVATVSVVSALQAELVAAQTRIQELETEQRSSRKKVKHFLRKLGEERTSWMIREHQRIRTVLDDLKDELNREKKNCQRMEIVNSRLLKDLADAKSSAKQFMQDYEKERKARKILEDASNELVRQIEEDKAKVEALNSESMRVHEEIEEERKMLQMADVWREQRVQMKLVDAKLVLEQKYHQMNNLIADLETFLRSRDISLDMIEMSEAEVIRQAVNSVDIQDIKEFSYDPSKLNDIYSISEELRNGEAKELEINQCINYSPASHASKNDSISPEINRFSKNSVQKHSNGFIDPGQGSEDISACETLTHVEDGGSNLSTKTIGRGRNISVSRTEHEENAGQDSLISENSEICLVSAKSKRKASLVCNLLRSRASNGDVYKTILVEGNGRLLNGSTSNMGMISPGGLHESVLGGHQDLVVQYSSPASGNPHITRGMKGCIEWPREIQWYSLKAKLFEARVESQRAQLRNLNRRAR